MKKIPFRAVATAILYLETDHEKPIHYEVLAQRVMDTDLSGLGSNGTNPGQTLNAELGKHKEVFTKIPRGHWLLTSPEEAAKLTEVREAIAAIQELYQRKRDSEEMGELRRRLQELEERNSLLEKSIATIEKSIATIARTCHVVSRNKARPQNPMRGTA